MTLLEANLFNILSKETSSLSSWFSDGVHKPNASSYPSLSFNESPSSFLLILSVPSRSSDGVSFPNASSYPSLSFADSPSSFLLDLSFFAIKNQIFYLSTNQMRIMLSIVHLG